MRPILAVALVVAAVAAPAAALACSCMRQESAAAHLRAADLAFEGRALGTRVAPGGEAVTRFRVSQVLKGRRVPNTVEVGHQTNGAACGLSYRPGAAVLVLAHRVEPNRHRTGLCSTPQFPLAAYRTAALGATR